MPSPSNFAPTRTAALERLSKFVPKAGRSYTARRNYDHGAGSQHAVSTLSPYLRTRLITEPEVIKAVLGRHSENAAEKFIQEVFWRTYWKGWLQLRPVVWDHYQSDLRQALDAVHSQARLGDRWQSACRGQTGIDCFNVWSQELVNTGYIHNHARMWFASIWIFTLRLPWELGADFFLRHLLDGDPASNTLSWRWVAGLQTAGKTYLARASNISKYTDGRFSPTQQLALQAPARTGHLVPPPAALGTPPEVDTRARTGLLLHHDDLSPGFVFDQATPGTLCQLQVDNGIGPLPPARTVSVFRAAATEDACARYADRVETRAAARNVEEILTWAGRENLKQIVTAEAPVGPVATLLDDLASHPDAPRVCRLRQPYDTAAWPHATKGYFNFKRKIPGLLSQII